MKSASAEFSPGGVYLNACLAPFEDILSRPEVTDVCVNRPREIWIETTDGTVERREDPSLSEAILLRLAHQIAALTHQGVNREHPLLSAPMPDGSRIQIILPPATRGTLALAIRRQVAPAITLQDYSAAGQFLDTRATALAAAQHERVRALIAKRAFAEALSLAVRARMNIVVCGGTGTGKTTFLNALLREVPSEERLILIEDTPELIVGHRNCVGLVSVRGQLGEAQVTTNDLVSASLRMRPDRIILGELRGPEAFAFLRAIKSGHPGSMTSIHADSPATAIEQLTMLVLQTGLRLGSRDVHDYVFQSVDLFVQLARAGGKRSVETVVLREDLHVLDQGGLNKHPDAGR